MKLASPVGREVIQIISLLILAWMIMISQLHMIHFILDSRAGSNVVTGVGVGYDDGIS